MSAVTETRPAQWREGIALAAAQAIIMAVLVTHLLLASLLDGKRSKW
jgi:hypothetical protein